MSHNLLVWAISPRCLRLVGGFGVGLLNNVTQIRPRLTPVAMATKFETKKGYNSACVRDISKIFLFNGVFRVKLSNDVREILQRQTLVAMATKFGTRWVIT